MITLNTQLIRLIKMSESGPKGDIAKNETAIKTENESERPRIVPPQEQPRAIDPQAIAQVAQDDRNKLAEVRKSLSSEPRPRRGWMIARRPRKEWQQKQESRDYSDSPIDQMTIWLKSFSKTAKETKRINNILSKELQEDRAKYPEEKFDYTKGRGVEGRVGRNKGVLATGFYECSGLVLQTPDGVAVVHISPNAFKDPSEGGELVQDRDVWGNVRSVMKGLASGDSTTEATENNTDLSESEITKLQEMADSGKLRATLLAGEDNIVPHEVATGLGYQAKSNNLPFIKTDIHYVGEATGNDVGYSGNEKGNSIYANPENVYFIGSNGQVLKKDENLPPLMYEYRDR